MAEPLSKNGIVIFDGTPCYPKSRDLNVLTIAVLGSLGTPVRYSYVAFLCNRYAMDLTKAEKADQDD